MATEENNTEKTAVGGELCLLSGGSRLANEHKSQHRSIHPKGAFARVFRRS